MENNIRLNWQAIVKEAVKRRKAQGLTQVQLAMLAGVSKPTMVKFEKCDLSISVNNAVKIFRVLGLD